MSKSVIRIRLLLVCLLAAVTSAVLMADEKNQHPVARIAAASSLQFALNEIVAAFIEESGHREPQIVYGSSGNLFRQIMQGAAFDVFISADSELVAKLSDSGRTDAQGQQFGLGRLVLYVGNATQLSPDHDLSGFQKALETGTVISNNRQIELKLAMANPRHAPYGRAAQQALESLQLWQQAQPHLVFGEKVSQAAQFVVSGASEMALISLSLALSEPLQASGRYLDIDSKHHLPVVQSMVLVDDTTVVARDFVTFVQESVRAADILRDYGLR